MSFNDPRKENKIITKKGKKPHMKTKHTKKKNDSKIHQIKIAEKLPLCGTLVNLYLS